MPGKIRYLGSAVVLMLLVGTASSIVWAETARNIIFMVPDGMGLANVTAARTFKNGLDGDSLHFETLSVIGYQRTFSRNSAVTDSAAAASAWACGEKFNNGEICMHVEDGSHPKSILELAKERRKATGLVATSTITHATPAAFGAHVTDRNCENEIARQYIQGTQPDVILGGGKGKFDSTIPDKCGTSGDFISEAQAHGYAIAFTKAEMDAAVSAGGIKLLGLFNTSGMTPEYLRLPGTTEPSLPEMASAALKILEKDPQGFLLVIEGSQIDWANHANDFEYMVEELLAFDDAVQVVLDWIHEKSSRTKNTLIIVIPDHETGGFAINGLPKDLSVKEDLDSIKTGWASKEHTGTDTLIWSRGPGSKSLGRPIDNTGVYDAILKVLK